MLCSGAAHEQASGVALGSRLGEGEALVGGVQSDASGVSLLVVGGFGDSRHLRDTEMLRLPKDLVSLLYTLDDLWQLP